MESSSQVRQSVSATGPTFTFPKAKYPLLEVGVPQGQSKLEVTLKRCSIPYENFITKCNAIKETVSSKGSAKKPCLLILCSDGFVTRGVKNQKIHVYNYYEVEQIKKIDYEDPTKFGFRLNFYAKEEGASIKVMTFECEENEVTIAQEIDAKPTSRDAAFLNSSTTIISTTSLGESTPGENAGGDVTQFEMADKREFAFIHCFHRMLQVWWQRFFEDNLKMNEPMTPDKGIVKPEVYQHLARVHEKDCYQFHGFVLKKNSWGMYQRRFQVLTMYWLHNVEADFDKKTKVPTFKKSAWKLPIESIEKIELSMKDNNCILNLLINKIKMNDKLQIFGGQRINKDSRKLMFKDLASARNFLYQVCRLYQFWNQKKLPIVDLEASKKK